MGGTLEEKGDVAYLLWPNQNSATLQSDSASSQSLLTGFLAASGISSAAASQSFTITSRRHIYYITHFLLMAMSFNCSN